MNRLLFLVVLTVSCVPLYPPPGDDFDGGAPTQPEDPPTMANDLTFNSRLMELRKQYDLYPWFQPYKVEQGVASPALTVRKKATHKQPYDLVTKELVGVGSMFVPANPVASWRNPFSVFMEWGQGQGAAQHAEVPILDSLALGRPDRDWQPFRSGLFLPRDTAVSAVIDAEQSDDAAVKAATYILWRGYRLWPKGSISPVQHTYPELAAKGYKLEPLTYQVELDPLETNAGEVSDTIYFDNEYLIDRIQFSYGFEPSWTDDHASSESTDPWGWISPNVLVRVDTQGTPLFGDWSSAPLIGTEQRRTSTEFPIPLTVPEGTTWTVREKADYPVTAVGWTPNVGDKKIRMVLHGSRLIAPSAHPRTSPPSRPGQKPKK